MLKARYKKHSLHFNEPGGTSRGVLYEKNSWYIIVENEEDNSISGIGECSIIEGLSIDRLDDFEQKLKEVCNDIENWKYWLENGLMEYPSIRFGLETAIKDLEEGGKRLLFPSNFTDGGDSIPINGLVWMGTYSEMKARIRKKLHEGFNCIKIKVGAINFDEEIRLLNLIRHEYNSNTIELRLDANGAFSQDVALEKLSKLAEFDIHSIEQPVLPGQWDVMAQLVEKSPIPIALDEELIGLTNDSSIDNMLETIKPQYIILKPSLLGGLAQSNFFIKSAENKNINWWVTSALESNIGLNAISQWAYTLMNPLPQGLGTGQLYTNNIESPLTINNARLYYDHEKPWDISKIL